MKSNKIKSINSIITFKIGTALLCAILLVIIVANMAIPICFFNSLKDINRDITKSINTLFSNTVDKTQSIFDMISTNDTVLSAVSEWNEVTGDDTESILKRRRIVSSNIDGEIVTLRSMNQDVVNNIIIASKECDKVIYSTGLGDDDKKLISYVAEHSTGGVTMHYLDEFSGYDWIKNHIYMLSRPVFDKNGAEIAEVIFVLNNDAIDKFEKKNNIFILKNDKIIFKKADRETLLNEISDINALGIYDNNNTDYIRTIGGKKYLVSYDASNNYGWMVVNLVSVDDLYETVNTIKILSFIVSLVFFVLFAFILKIFSKRISEKLSIVIAEMNEPANLSDFKKKSNLLGRVGFRTKMMTLSVVTIIVPTILFAGVMSYEYTEVIKKENELLTNDFSNLKGYIIENNISNAENVIKYILTDRTTKERIYALQNDYSRDNYDAVTECVGRLLPEDMSVRIRIYSDDGGLVYTGFEDFDAVLSNSGQFEKPDSIATDYSIRTDAVGDATYVIAKKILSSGEGFEKPLGYIEILMNEDTLFKNFKDDGSYFEYLILDDNGKIVRSKLPTIVGTDFESAPDILAQRMLNDRYVSKVTLGEHAIGFYVLYQNEMSDLYNRILLLLMLMTCLACLVIAIIMGRHLSDFVLKPVYTANAHISKVEEMDFSGDISRAEGDELDGLIEGVNDMKIKIKQLIDDLYQQKIMEKELETIALQTQIAPHFLYNTLETINALVDMGDNTRACDMICLLSEFFRKGISRQKHILTLKEEIEYTKIYIQIQKIRFGDDLIVVWELGNDVEDCEIVNFAIQPLVENSLKHGDFSSDETKIIRIKAYRTKDKLKVAVIDNGHGIDADTLCEMNESFNLGGIPTKNIGLKNISDRVKLYFGEEYGVKVYSRENKGTIVKIELPIKM